MRFYYTTLTDVSVSPSPPILWCERQPSALTKIQQTLLQSTRLAKRAMAKFALGHHREASDAGCVRAVLAEFILTFLFVFAGVGSAMATGRYRI